MSRSKTPEFIGKNIDEIRSSRALRIYGSLLALVHLATWHFWRTNVPQWMADTAHYICWPIFPNCEVTRGLSPDLWKGVLILYAVFSIAVSALFISRRAVGYAWAGLVLLNVFKQGLLLQDYRLMGNYHYMPLVASFAFLFLPDKRRCLRLLLVLFYLSAGALKLNDEWLLGAALGKSPPSLSPLQYQYLCAYVVLLELLVSWLLLARTRVWRLFALSQFLIFHAVSWYWVGYFYPVIMYLLLAIFPLSWREEKEPAGEMDWRVNWPRQTFAQVFIFAYVAAQLAPWFTGKDPALEGNLRLSSLNMFDARTQCLGVFTLRYDGHIVEYEPNLDDLGIRIHCDPIVFRSEMKKICAKEALQPEFIGADIHLVAKRTTSESYTELLRIRDFCREPVL